MIPSAEGPFKGLDVMARYCFGLLYDRYQLSSQKHKEGDSRFTERRTVRVCDVFPDSPGLRHDTSTATMAFAFCVYKQSDLDVYKRQLRDFEPSFSAATPSYSENKAVRPS